VVSAIWRKAQAHAAANVLFEQPVELRVDAVDDAAQVFAVVSEIAVVHIHHQELAFGEFAGPSFVVLVEAPQVIQTEVLFVIAAAFLDLVDQRGDGRFEVNDQIRRADERADGFVQPCVVFKVARGHQPHGVQVGGEDAGIFVNGAVLNDGFLAALDIDHLAEAAVEKEDLQVEGPTRHVLVKVEEIRVVLHVLVMGFPPVVFSQQLRQRGLAGANVSGYGHMLDGGGGWGGSFGHAAVVLSWCSGCDSLLVDRASKIGIPLRYASKAAAVYLVEGVMRPLRRQSVQ